MLFSNYLGLVPLLASSTFAAQAFFSMNSLQPLTTVRLDPIVSPGSTGPHVHSVMGGNAFRSSMTYSITQTSTCGTVPVKVDNSNYWIPVLYFHAKNGSFIRVPELPLKQITYMYQKSDGTADPGITEFPQGFAMLTGSSTLRTNDGTLGTSGTQQKWTCHQASGSDIQAVGFPTGFTKCDGPNQLQVFIRFPSCWNGNAVDPNKPTAHMAFPIAGQAGTGGCPVGFQKARFPEIQVSVAFATDTFNGEYTAADKPWVLSNGDSTGDGYHGDFYNGWKVGALANAMKTCLAGSTGKLDDPTCFGSGSLYTAAQMDACNIAPQVSENVGILSYPQKDSTTARGGILSQLPGNNPVSKRGGRYEAYQA